MLRWAVLLMKLIIGSAVIWLTTVYVRHHYPDSFEIIAVSACIYLVGVALINEQNVFRVLVNWFIIGLFTGGCWLFGYFMSPHPESDFDRENIWFLRIICAIIGAPMGYVVCLMRQQWQTKPDPDEEEDESQLESDQYVDVAHD